MKGKTFDRYVNYICEELDVSIVDLFKKERSEKLSRARYILYTICYNTNFTILEIKDYMSKHGYKTSRQTIEHGLSRIEDISREDIDVKRFINESIEYLNSYEYAI